MTRNRDLWDPLDSDATEDEPWQTAIPRPSEETIEALLIDLADTCDNQLPEMFGLLANAIARLCFRCEAPPKILRLAANMFSDLAVVATTTETEQTADLEAIALAATRRRSWS